MSINGYLPLIYWAFRMYLENLVKPLKDNLTLIADTDKLTLVLVVLVG